MYNRFCKRFFAAVIVRTTAQADSRALVILYTYINRHARTPESKNRTGAM